jgi:3-hydroxyacyl-CoA dehydrogenase / enoyl-CoA hydratase / 3-hydroxybutyryl-CoA epimerase / enoyl-CoA isomerase
MNHSSLRLEIQDKIATVTFDLPNSRANTLGQAVLADFENLLPQLEGNKDLQGLLFQSGKPGMFIAGADLKELGAAVADLEQTRKLVKRGLDIIARLEKLPFPTIALIDGSCMGGGTEIALGFDFRLAGTNAKTEIGLPETKIGLIPGWGGTQRLTRVIGPSIAAEMICAGEAAKAERARELGLVFDVVPSEKLRVEALRILQWARESGAHFEARKKKQQPVGLTEEQHSYTFAVAKAMVLAKTKGQLPAPLAALEAIAKGCNLPLEQGLKAETDAFAPLVGSPVAQNLIAIFFMQQRLAKDPGVADAKVQPRHVERVGVLGAGIMGAGIAGAHIRRGVPVLLLDSVPQALEKGVMNIAKVMQTRIAIGRMTQEEMLGAM